MEGKLDWVTLRRGLANEGPLGRSRREWSGLRPKEEPGLTSSALGPSLFLCRPFRGWQGLETLVRDRGAALDRQAVCPGRQTLLSTLECVESLAQLVRQGFVELVEVEARREVRRLLPAGILAVVLVDSMSESVFKFTPFRGEQLPGAFRVHQFALPISAALEGTRRTTSPSFRLARHQPGTAPPRTS